MLWSWRGLSGLRWVWFNITVIQDYASTTNAEEAEVEWFYDDLQDRLELTPKREMSFSS